MEQKGQVTKPPANPVHQMKIYEEFVRKEKAYSFRNRTEEFNINPQTSNLIFFLTCPSCKHNGKA